MLNYSDINIDNIQEELFNASELIDKYKEILNDSNILQSGSFNNMSLAGIFDEDLWVYSHYISKSYTYIDFSKLSELIFYGLSEEDALLIKCWVADNLVNRTYEYFDTNEKNTSSKVRTEYNYLIDFIEISKNFSSEFIDEENGSIFEEYYKKDVTDGTIKNQVGSIISYIDFIEEKFIEDKKALAITYIDKLNSLNNSLKHSRKSRILPCSKDILLFDNYIKAFFNSDLPYELKMHYYPIKIWWKITNVIPLRISEFCLKLNRGCVIEYNDSYYLKIGRLKKKADLGNNLLPVLTDIKITKDIYEMINYYIEQTNPYGESETLISYAALVHYRVLLNKINDNLFSLVGFHNRLHNENSKYFTSECFSQLLDSFYNKIVRGICSDTQIKEQILPNDTRHFAFTSLVLQGFSPVKIAILGGHRTLESLDSYTCSCNTYIDSEVITIIHKNLSEGTLNRTSIKKIVFSKPEECPIPKSKTFETQIDNIKLGYCTADFTKEHFPCECDDCYNCPNWWCSPTEDSYNLLIDIISNKLTGDTDKLNRDIGFMKTLFKKSSLIAVNGNLFLDKDAENKLKRSSLLINSKANKLINLKSKLINNDITEKVIEQLNDINLHVENIINKSISTRSES